MFVKGYFMLFVLGVVLFNHFVLDFWGFVFVVTYHDDGDDDDVFCLYPFYIIVFIV